MIDEIKNSFEKKFGKKPHLFRSPGRINLIGEHTDYNDGFVLPAAIDKAVWFAVKPNNKREYHFYAQDFDEQFVQKTGSLKPAKVHWVNYLLGVVAQFEKNNHPVPGFDCVFGGNIPIGAGMSSSAAIETGMAYALNDIFQFGYSTLKMVKLSQQAEHEFAGVHCGIMDQFAVMNGRKGQAIHLDCRSLEYRYVPLNMDEYNLVLVNTGVKHALAASEYNKRRQECATGIRALKKYDDHIRALRDVNRELIDEHKKDLDSVIYKRCNYVIRENERVQKACDALQNHDLDTFGRLMYASHQGLQNEYDVSCPELDRLVDVAQETGGVLGARMMGGGFGGCTLNLVMKSHLSEFEEKVISSYKTPEGNRPDIYSVQIDGGTNRTCRK